MGINLKDFTLVYIFIIYFVSGIINADVDVAGSSISPNNHKILNEFREKVKPVLTEDYMKTDFYLARWLKANDFDIRAAEIMLIKNLKWRKDNKMTTIHLENFEDMKTEFPTSLDTFDKDGRPVGTMEVAVWNIRNAVITGRSKRLLRYIDMLLENVTKQVLEKREHGINVTQWSVIMNAEGVNMINHGCPMCIRIWMQFMHSLDNYYPEWLHEFVAVDAPFAVFTIVDILRPALSRHTRQNMKVFGMDRRTWVRYLDTKISRQERREVYGGVKWP